MGDYSVNNIYSFETPSSTEWNYTNDAPFLPSVFFDITNTVRAKIDGMNCYETESTLYPHPRSSEALIALAKYRGSNAGVGMAEGFMSLREVIR